MQGTMLIYRPGKTEPEVREFDRAPDEGDLKDGIGGGWLEMVPGFTSITYRDELRSCVALVDEEGKLDYRTSGLKKSAPDETNQWATLLWDRALKRAGHPGLITPDGQVADYLVGQVAVLFGDREFMDAL
jgi:hypothetical protein